MKVARYVKCIWLALAGMVLPGFLEGQNSHVLFPLEPWQAVSLGMAGAGVAVEGAPFTRSNPAALGGQRGGVLLTYRESAAGTTDVDGLGFYSAAPISLALAFRDRRYEDLAADLGLDGLDASETAIGAVVAWAPVRHLSIGAAAHNLSADYLGNRFTGWAYDTGVRVNWHGVSAGVSVSGLGRLRGRNSEHALNRVLRAGGAAEVAVRAVDIGLSVEVLFDEMSSQPEVMPAAWIGLSDILWLRTGCVAWALSGDGLPCAVGFSVRPGWASVDVAYSNTASDLGSEISIGLSITSD